MSLEPNLNYSLLVLLEANSVSDNDAMQVRVLPSNSHVTVSGGVPVAGRALHQTTSLLENSDTHNEFVILRQVLQFRDGLLRDRVDPGLDHFGLIRLFANRPLNDLCRDLIDIRFQLLQIHSLGHLGARAEL